MSIDVVVDYGKVVKEIRTPSLRKEVVAFLSMHSYEEVDRMVDSYARKLNSNRFQPKRDYNPVLDILWGFKRKGTIRPLMSEEEILEMARESKRETYL